MTAFATPLPTNPQRDSFLALGLPPTLTRNIPRHWVAPLPVQALVIPPALKGVDVLGLSPTGSGKTAAFLLPIIAGLLRPQPNGIRRPGPRAILLAPVRELAVQTHESCTHLCHGLGINVALLRGGTSEQADISAIRRSPPDIVIGTLGRIARLSSNKDLILRNVDVLVLDEVDKMIYDLRSLEFSVLWNQISSVRQTMAFSATLPPSTEDAVGGILRNPVRIDLGVNHPPAQIRFEEYPVESHIQKLPLFTTLMRERGFERGLVFMSRKAEINIVESLLKGLGFPCAALHHDRSQGYCERMLADFKAGRVPFLLASDALQRGIDVTGLPLVVNYDFPGSYADFTHRAGRTGRRELPGLVISFLTESNRRMLAEGSGRFAGFRQNLDLHCNIERMLPPDRLDVLSPQDARRLEAAMNAMWGDRR